MANFPAVDVPSGKWSFTNRTLMFLSGTGDARGFRQWKKAGRYVRKGTKAIFILAPTFSTVENEDEDNVHGNLQV